MSEVFMGPNPTPTIVLDRDRFPFVDGLNVGEKGVLDFSAVITGESMMDEDDLVVKELKLLGASPNSMKEARMS